jgi:hypothetical protein
VQVGTPELVRLLIARGANVNEVNPVWNSTALTFARDANNTPIIETLLDAGATDRLFEENGGETVRDNSTPLRAIEKYLTANRKPGEPDQTWSHSGVMTKDTASVRLERQGSNGETIRRDLVLKRKSGSWVVTEDR